MRTLSVMLRSWPLGLLAALAALPAQALNWSGYLRSEHRASMHAPYPWTWHETRLVLRSETDPTAPAAFSGEVWIRTLGFPQISNTGDLSDPAAVAPWDLQLREAYGDVYDFLVPGLQLRLGRQRIAWGRGDQVNPTDNLNPDDLEDLWEYGRHLGSDAVKLTYVFGNAALTGVFIPYFTPAVLPRGDLAAFLTSDLELPAGFSPGTVTEATRLPAQTLADGASAALKLSGRLGGVDLTASYYYGRDDLPLLHRLFVVPDWSGRADVDAELMFPRMQVVGLDAAGELFGLGVWIEAAVSIPEEVPLEIRLDPFWIWYYGAMLGQPLPAEGTALASEPYVKYLVGLDYTFSGGVYLNAQYLHGFFHERGRDQLGDYLLASLDWELVEETLTVTPVGVALEIRDWSRPEDTYSFVAMPQLTYRPFDNAELLLGGRWIWGTAESTFGKLAGADETFIRFQYSY